MKTINCYIAKLLNFLLAIASFFVLVSFFSPKVYAALDTGVRCENKEDCVNYTQNPAAYCSGPGGTCVVPVASIPESSLEKFQTIVKKSEEKGETNLQWFVGSDNGIVESMTNALTGLIVGNDIDWEQLRAGNFEKARIGGAFGFTSNLVAQILTTPPVSSREYFADLGKNFGLAKPAYAQGIGFKGLSNLLPLWKATRNLAYILFVIVFLATGLAIMFRVKLDPKTVVTIQNAIPKLIVALILVTFSYAIAGLLIDLIYVIIYLGILAFGGLGINVAAEQVKFTSLSFPEGIGLIVGGGVQALFNAAKESIGNGILEALLRSVAAIFIVATLVVSALTTLIFALIALFLILKLFFALLLCYAHIIISVIVAPLQIMLGALPGSSMGFNSWFRNLLANILVFPTVALFLLVGWLLTNKGYNPTWTPPVLGVNGEALPALIGFAMLFLVNKVPDMVKGAFKMKPAGYGTALGEAFGPLRTGGKVVIGGAVERGYSYITRVGGPGWAQPGQFGRGALDVVKSGIDRALKKW